METTMKQKNEMPNSVFHFLDASPIRSLFSGNALENDQSVAAIRVSSLTNIDIVFYLINFSFFFHSFIHFAKLVIMHVNCSLFRHLPPNESFILARESLNVNTTKLYAFENFMIFRNLIQRYESN